MEVLFANSDSKFAIATHDSKLIRDAIRLAKTGGSLNNKRFEFQFLMGIRDEQKLELVTNGYSVLSVYPLWNVVAPVLSTETTESKNEPTSAGALLNSEIIS